MSLSTKKTNRSTQRPRTIPRTSIHTTSLSATTGPAKVSAGASRVVIQGLKADVEGICFPRGRMVGSPGHRKARAYLAARLEEAGCIPFRGDSFELPYQRKGKSFCNLVGVVRGKNSRLAPLLVGAHYDSAIAAPCADDNAAAVAIALAVTRIAALGEVLRRDLIVAIFDAEEQPYYQTGSMGSQRFWHDQRGGRLIHSAIIMDLVGHDVSVHSSLVSHLPRVASVLSKIPGLADRDIPIPVFHPLVFLTGTESHPKLKQVLESTGAISGLKLVPTLNSYIGDMSDHGVFRKNGVPYYFLSCGHWAHYHKKTDTPDRLNYRKMDRITLLTCRLLCELDTQTLRRTGNKECVCDTFDMEVQYMRRAFGPLWPVLLRRAGLDGVRTRDHMNILVESILTTGL